MKRQNDEMFVVHNVSQIFTRKGATSDGKVKLRLALSRLMMSNSGKSNIVDVINVPHLQQLRQLRRVLAAFVEQRSRSTTFMNHITCEWLTRKARSHVVEGGCRIRIPATRSTGQYSNCSRPRVVDKLELCR